MSEKIVIIGAGETAMLAYEYFTHDSKNTIACFVVDTEHKQADELNGLPLTTIDEIEVNYPPNEYRAFVAISSGQLNRKRADMYHRIKKMGYSFASYISSRAFIWNNVEIGENCFILENNVLQPFTKVGNNVTLWSGNHVGHRTEIGDHCFISSHCVISGFCEIGESCFLGVNCTLEDQVIMAADNFIGASALIQKNTDINSFYQNKQTELSKVSTHRLFRIK